MNNKEVKYKIDSEEDLAELITELKNLPAVELPSDFDSKLRNKLANENLKQKKSFFSYSSYSKSLVYGASFVVVVCLVIFSVTIFRNSSEPVIKEAAIDSVSYGDKKVVVIPPTDNSSVEGSIEKPIEKVTRKKEKAITHQEMKEYFGEEKAEQSLPSVQSRTFMAPSIEKKSMEMDRSIKIDTLKKKDSLKKTLEKKK